MKKTEIDRCLKSASSAAREVGELMRRHARSNAKKIDDETQHDIKLELDSRSQRLIEKRLLAAYPDLAVLGEEGTVGDMEAPHRWVVDPIDGTVNFAYGIPHACVSIALQRRRPDGGRRARQYPDLAYETVAGAVYDPFQDEMWTAAAHGPARLNGRKISVSSRDRLDRAIVAMGFAKHRETMDAMLPVFAALIPKVRKVRLMGATALSLVYVATGRMDAYLDPDIRLWDIAAGGLILERAGGRFKSLPVSRNGHRYAVTACNGLLFRKIGAVQRRAVRGASQ